jgi:hypothetical protein
MTLITTGLREADRTARCWLALTLDCFGLTILMFLL